MFSVTGNVAGSGRLSLPFSKAKYLDLRRKVKYIALSNLSIYYTWENIKKPYKNIKFKTSAPIWNEEFELPDGSYSISDIQDYLKYILKTRGEKTVNPSTKNIHK